MLMSEKDVVLRRSTAAGDDNLLDDVMTSKDEDMYAKLCAAEDFEEPVGEKSPRCITGSFVEEETEKAMM